MKYNKTGSSTSNLILGTSLKLGKVAEGETRDNSRPKNIPLFLYPLLMPMNTPPHIATAVQSFGEGNSDSDSDCYRREKKVNSFDWSLTKDVGY